LAIISVKSVLSALTPFILHLKNVIFLLGKNTSFESLPAGNIKS